MKKHRNGDTKKIETFFEIFPKITKIITTKLGPKPFHLRGPLNISALDSVFSVLIENFDRIDEKILGEQYISLKNDKEFIEHTSINTTDNKTVEARIKTVYKYLIK